MSGPQASVGARSYDERVLIGTARPDENQSFDVEGRSLEEITAQIAAKTPVGWEATHAPVAMVKGDTLLKSTTTIERRDGLIEVEGEDLDGVRAKLPAGYRLLSLRRV